MLLRPFKAIWDRDKSKGKYLAKQELGYIYFMEDPRSDYQYIMERDARAEEIMEGEGMPKDWKPDKLVLDAAAFYSTFKSPEASLLEKLQGFLKKLEKMLEDANPGMTNDNGEYITLPNQWNQLLTTVSNAITQFKALKTTVFSDMATSGKVRGNREKAVFEDND